MFCTGVVLLRSLCHKQLVCDFKWWTWLCLEYERFMVMPLICLGFGKYYFYDLGDSPRILVFILLRIFLQITYHEWIAPVFISHPLSKCGINFKYLWYVFSRSVFRCTLGRLGARLVMHAGSCIVWNTTYFLMVSGLLYGRFVILTRLMVHHIEVSQHKYQSYLVSFVISINFRLVVFVRCSRSPCRFVFCINPSLDWLCSTKQVLTVSHCSILATGTFIWSSVNSMAKRN